MDIPNPSGPSALGYTAGMAYVQTRLGRWFFEDRGDIGARTVVLAHGLLFDRTMWAAQIEPLLALGARVLTFDNPGHGNSEVPPPFSLDDHARALVDALDAWKVERPVVVGLSWGGMLAMRLAIGHAQRVRAIVLADTTASAEPRANRLKYRALASFEKHFGLPHGLAEKQIAPLLFSPDVVRHHPEIVAHWEKRLVGFSRLGIYRAAKAVVIDRPEVVSKLSAIDAPTLVVCGTEDIAQPPAESEKLVSGIRGAKLAMIAGAGHMSAIEKPKAFNDAVIPFVRDNLA